MPWAVKFEDGQRDNRLFDKLKAEAAGILAWLVRGCYKWMDDGLTEPAAIMHATDALAAEQDHITPFLDEVCDRSDRDALVLADDLFQARQAWNASRNERPGESQKAFGDALKARGILHGPLPSEDAADQWNGLKLRGTFMELSMFRTGPGLYVSTPDEEKNIRALLDESYEDDAWREHQRLLLDAV